ncbi:MAG: prepilin-type N-terminal cleavage/methylation domain-containing protein [Nitrospirota bacterium]
MNSSSGNSKSKAGFTLLEVIISIAILSVILAAIYSTFFLSHQAMEGMDESLTKIQEARRAVDILRCEIEAAYYREVESNTLFKIEDRDMYGKQATQLSFTAFSTLRPGLSKISYYVEKEEDRLTLLKKVESSHGKEESEGVDIIEDIDAFSIEAKYNDAWVKTWDAAINKSTPDEIRIGLTMTIKGHKVALSDIAKPRIGKQI